MKFLSFGPQLPVFHKRSNFNCQKHRKFTNRGGSNSEPLVPKKTPLATQLTKAFFKVILELHTTIRAVLLTSSDNHSRHLKNRIFRRTSTRGSGRPRRLPCEPVQQYVSRAFSWRAKDEKWQTVSNTDPPLRVLRPRQLRYRSFIL